MTPEENKSTERTKEEIWDNTVKGWKLIMTAKGHRNALLAMEEYASQQSAEDKKRIAELEAQVKALKTKIDNLNSPNYGRSSLLSSK